MAAAEQVAPWLPLLEKDGDREGRARFTRCFRVRGEETSRVKGVMGLLGSSNGGQARAAEENRPQAPEWGRGGVSRGQAWPGPQAT